MEIEVNGGPHRETVENTSSDLIIIGGLRKGANKITVRPALRPIGQPGPPRLEIIVLARTGNPARPIARLLAWKIPPGNLEGILRPGCLVEERLILERSLVSSGPHPRIYHTHEKSYRLPFRLE